MKTDKKQSIGFQVEYLESVDSTNTYLKQLAAGGAPHGLAAVAHHQTGGRGRFGRSFESAAGKGLYLSVLLRPHLPVEQISLITPWAAVAVCRAVESLTDLRPGIKWINDLLLEDKKLCGILTEAELNPDGTLDHVILGIGLNLYQKEGDFSPEVASIATSLACHLPDPPARETVLEEILAQLNTMWQDFPDEQAAYLDAYRARCVTVGHPVQVITPAMNQPAEALTVNEDFSLSVRFSTGKTTRLNSGEVSLRRKI